MTMTVAADRHLVVPDWFLALVRKYVPQEHQAAAVIDYAKASARARKPLTLRQHQIYTYIRSSIELRGIAPTYGEIAARFHFGSLATVNEHLTTLEAKGYIRRGHRETRAITLTEVTA